jgi:hypothetical protein
MVYPAAKHVAHLYLVRNSETLSSCHRPAFTVRCSITPSTVGSTRHKEYAVPVLMGKGADKLMWLDVIQIGHE